MSNISSSEESKAQDLAPSHLTEAAEKNGASRVELDGPLKAGLRQAVLVLAEIGCAKAVPTSERGQEGQLSSRSAGPAFRRRRTHQAL